MFFLAVILFSGLINQSGVAKIILYCLFVILPFSLYGFAHINWKEGIVSYRSIFKLLFYIGLFQFPVLLIQRNFYQELIGWNRSGQKIEWYDFMYGTFFIKSDHSLCLFLLILISILIFTPSVRQLGVRFRWLNVSILSVAIFLTESNISKLFLSLLLAFVVILPIYRKYYRNKRFQILTGVFLLSLIFMVFQLKDYDFMKKRLGGKFEDQFSIETAYKQYENTTAKRSQIVLVAIKKLEPKFIGSGPFSYFDFFKGTFTKTQHFSQLIWAYFDLGFLGLFAVILLIFSIVKSITTVKGVPFVIFSGIIIVYAFYTTILADIAIMASLFILFKQKID
ncbi:hypothetical protein [Robertkochia flava]|uniref:hypothetical protein n=1 Tax=Robertkochia flava TaxID=3447986 RepID=UPI001CCA7E57|nr:hypothetical protein [Robertkochia marina]